MTPADRYTLIAIPNQNRAATFRQVVTEALGLDSVLVRDGDAALETLASRGLPTLVIVDLSLPRVDGFAVVRKLRRQATEADTRIVVVAAHEALLEAARELSATLALSGILPLEVSHAALHDLLVSSFGRPQPDLLPPAPPRPTVTFDADDAIDRAAIDARRRFRMPISIGYTRCGEQENLTFHVSARGGEPPILAPDLMTFSFLRQVADSEDPLVIPSVDDHPVFAQRLERTAKAIKGFAVVPIASGRDDMSAALCLLDVKPLTMTAADIDAFASFGRSISKDLEGATVTGKERSALDVSLEDVKALQHLAATDPLTGLANRRGGEKHIASEIARAKRERRPLSCILLDIDRFKHVNDTFGHQAGDQLLRDISALLRRTVRAYDVLVRWGGEEFLLVLPGVDLELARVLAERVRQAVEMSDTHGIGRITVSAGVARFDDGYDFATTLRTADQRLYEAKASGRNCVV